MIITQAKVTEFLNYIETTPGQYGVVGNESPKAVNALGKSVPLSWFMQLCTMVEKEVLSAQAEQTVV